MRKFFGNFRTQNLCFFCFLIQFIVREVFIMDVLLYERSYTFLVHELWKAASLILNDAMATLSGTNVSTKFIFREILKV
jgi:hypothetical protein